jgi:4'-phosphopantetheinyl transferase EntD
MIRSSAVIEALFTSPVAVEVATTSDYFAPIDIEEAPYAERMVERRRQEFAAGRACAHRALKRIDADFGPIRVAHRRDPVWPVGIVGSITHCEGFCAAVVARGGPIAGLGIDAEPARQLDDETRNTILNSEEQAALSRIPLPPGLWTTMGFAAKEALFKAVYPVLIREIAFDEIVLSVHNWPQLRAIGPEDPELNAVVKKLDLRGGMVDSVVVVAATLKPQAS